MKASRDSRLPSGSVTLSGTSFVGAPGVSLIYRPLLLLQCGMASIFLHSLFSMLISTSTCRAVCDSFGYIVAMG